MTETEICRRCKKPKHSSSAGMATQMVDVCGCDLISPEQEKTITICISCGKRIKTREGSITQWIFGDGLCKCAKPDPQERSIDSFVQPAFDGFYKDQSEKELDLDQSKFPIERYKPVAILGKGASGIVYLARDRILGKKVAVKI